VDAPSTTQDVQCAPNVGGILRSFSDTSSPARGGRSAVGAAVSSMRDIARHCAAYATLLSERAGDAAAGGSAAADAAAAATPCAVSVFGPFVASAVRASSERVVSSAFELSSALAALVSSLSEVAELSVFMAPNSALSLHGAGAAARASGDAHLATLGAPLSGSLGQPATFDRSRHLPALIDRPFVSEHHPADPALPLTSRWTPVGPRAAPVLTGGNISAYGAPARFSTAVAPSAAYVRSMMLRAAAYSAWVCERGAKPLAPPEVDEVSGTSRVTSDAAYPSSAFISTSPVLPAAASGAALRALCEASEGLGVARDAMRHVVGANDALMHSVRVELNEVREDRVRIRAALLSEKRRCHSVTSHLNDKLRRADASVSALAQRVATLTAALKRTRVLSEATLPAQTETQAGVRIDGGAQRGSLEVAETASPSASNVAFPKCEQDLQALRRSMTLWRLASRIKASNLPTRGGHGTAEDNLPGEGSEFADVDDGAGSATWFGDRVGEDPAFSGTDAARAAMDRDVADDSDRAAAFDGYDFPASESGEYFGTGGGSGFAWATVDSCPSPDRSRSVPRKRRRPLHDKDVSVPALTQGVGGGPGALSGVRAPRPGCCSGCGGRAAARHLNGVDGGAYAVMVTDSEGIPVPAASLHFAGPAVASDSASSVLGGGSDESGPVVGVPVAARWATPALFDREAALSAHFEHRLAAMRRRVQTADSKAIAVFSQYREAVNQLTALGQERAKHYAMLARHKQAMTRARDELDTTRASYAKQMQVLTEQLLSMQARVAEEEDAAAKLRGAQVHCATCGAWNSISWLLAEGKGGQRCSGGNHPASFRTHNS
jgi:hypothetical protein